MPKQKKISINIGGQKVDLANKIESDPPKGMCLITNIYYNPEIDRIVVEYENEPEAKDR